MSKGKPQNVLGSGLSKDLVSLFRESGLLGKGCLGSPMSVEPLPFSIRLVLAHSCL